MSDPFVSVIVPVLNDAVQLDGLLLSLHLDQDVQDVEIIVANGAASSLARSSNTESPLTAPIAGFAPSVS